MTTVIAAERRLSGTLVFLFAVTAGLSAACLYYLQPLLHDIGHDLGVSAAAAGTIVSAAQVGYLVGLAFVVPLGDHLDRRKLVGVLLVTSFAALLGSAVAPGFTALLVFLAATGITAASAQVVVPWASSLAAPDERGAVVGRVMSGLLIGILGSRILSGLVAQVGGWRTVLACAAVLQLLMAIVVWVASPADPRAESTHTYPASLRSVLTLIRTRDALRHRMFLGAVNMAGFSLLWTSITFLLAGAHGSPYHFSDAAIGLFGLAGIAGAMGAPVVGRFADRGHVRRATYLMWAVQLIGWALLFVGGDSLPALIVALLVFDLGVQGLHLCNQAAIYALDEDARARITTAYMVAYFAGGIVGSLVAGITFQTGGWALVCGAGAASAVLGLAAWSVFARPPRVRAADQLPEGRATS